MIPRAVAFLSRLLSATSCVLLIGIIVSCVPPAHAAAMEARDPAGAVIVIDEGKGPCQGNARSAAHIAKDGTRTQGCWITDGRVVFIVFFDGDTASVPVRVFVKSKDA